MVVPETANSPRARRAWRYAAVEARGLPLDTWREITSPLAAASATASSSKTAAICAGHGAHRLRVDGRERALRTLRRRSAELYARVEIEVTLGKGAHFEFGGVTVGGRDTVREFVTRVVHAEPEATSNQVVRAVHWGQGTGNFLGSIEVARHAQKTDAAQSFKGLLLEKGASVNAVPQLEIFADDVKCAHGATVGQLDEQARSTWPRAGSPPRWRALLVQLHRRRFRGFGR